MGAVMASAGTRKYFRAKLGYRNDGAFMVKDLSAGASGRAVDGMFASSNEETEDLFEERIMARVGAVQERDAKRRTLKGSSARNVVTKNNRWSDTQRLAGRSNE